MESALGQPLLGASSPAGSSLPAPKCRVLTDRRTTGSERRSVFGRKLPRRLWGWDSQGRALPGQSLPAGTWPVATVVPPVVPPSLTARQAAPRGTRWPAGSDRERADRPRPEPRAGARRSSAEDPSLPSPLGAWAGRLSHARSAASCQLPAAGRAPAERGAGGGGRPARSRHAA